jgi:hypothetical protein
MLPERLNQARVDLFLAQNDHTIIGGTGHTMQVVNRKGDSTTVFTSGSDSRLGQEFRMNFARLVALHE